MNIGNDLRSYLVDYCNKNDLIYYNQVIVDLQDGYTQLSDNLMCTSKCKCVYVDQELWTLKGYPNINSFYFNGNITNIEDCTSLYYTSYNENVVSVMKDLE